MALFNKYKTDLKKIKIFQSVDARFSLFTVPRPHSISPGSSISCSCDIYSRQWNCVFLQFEFPRDIIISMLFDLPSCP